MLANVPPRGRDFEALARYLILGPAGAEANPDRVAWVETRNLATGDPMLAAKIMKATADLSVRVVKPVYQIIVSWQPRERPTREAMTRVIDTTLGEIGLSSHQAVVIAHQDTRNLHLHAAINLVHPETGVTAKTSHDFRRIEKVMRRLADAEGFVRVPGRHTEPEKFKDRVHNPSRGEFQLLRKKGRAEIPHWSITQTKALGEHLKQTFDDATSWNDVEQALDAFGGELIAKGQGLVITDRTRTGYAKLSALGGGIRLKDLEARFGRSWNAYRAEHPRQRKETPHAQPLVSEMDIVLSLYRAGLAKRGDVQAVVDDRERKMAEAPVAVQLEREMREALRAAVGKPKKRSKRVRAGPRPRDNEPEPHK